MSFNIRVICILLLTTTTVWSHGYVGLRFFPSAISQDEPFINDKLALPIFRKESPSSNGGITWTTNPELEYAKTITKALQVSTTASYLHIHPQGQNAVQGFDDWVVGLRYNLFLLPHIESAFSIGINSKLGGTGSQAVNAASTSLISPELLFAQGFGALPESAKWLRPFAFSTSVSPNFSTPHYNLSSVNWGLAVEYSLPYLKHYVSNKELPNFMAHTVPIIEFPFSECTQGQCKNIKTGTIDPGVIFYGKYGQIGLEALIPSNRNTGSKMGGVIQFYLYLDTMFPNSVGKPLIT